VVARRNGLLKCGQIGLELLNVEAARANSARGDPGLVDDRVSLLAVAREESPVRALDLGPGRDRDAALVIRERRNRMRADDRRDPRHRPRLAGRELTLRALRNIDPEIDPAEEPNSLTHLVEIARVDGGVREDLVPGDSGRAPILEDVELVS